MKRLLVLALSLALGFTATACTDSTGPGDAISGTYVLRTIGGAAPPVTIGSLEVIAGRIILDRNGDYAGVTTLRQNGGSQFEDRIDGYWTVSGNQISLTDQFDPNNPYIGTVSNRTITISGFNSGSGYDEVYSK